MSRYHYTSLLDSYNTSQSYYQRAAQDLAVADHKRKMAEKLTSPFTWKQFLFEFVLIGIQQEQVEKQSSLTIDVSVLLVSPFFSIIIVTELLYSYAEHIDQRAVPFVAT